MDMKNPQRPIISLYSGQPLKETRKLYTRIKVHKYRYVLKYTGLWSHNFLKLVKALSCETT